MYYFYNITQWHAEYLVAAEHFNRRLRRLHTVELAGDTGSDTGSYAVGANNNNKADVSIPAKYDH